MNSQRTVKTRSTQTARQPEPPRICVPLQIVDDDGKMRYCYHGGKCKCENCRITWQALRDELDRNLDAFIPNDRLKLEPGIRHAKQKPYRLDATRVSPEMEKMLLEDHVKLTTEIPIYYLPDKYYVKNAWRLEGPQQKGTQTEIVIGGFGIDGCPCPDKTVCWDI
ncbi:uncharacterized protein LOC6559475 [Drosophila grimshawi]|uniref:GH22110 n=1 Tax=Drosophila grimshawi TaxID=7222 RepID=B4J461_DROGR|nr:uncharacterized protein LOC6559475 [Drosophila grimshawi]EDW02667.1 GH22110 [Drosophila grimshawi]